MSITPTIYLMGRDTEYPITEEMEVNMTRLLRRVNLLLVEFRLTGVPTPGITSGYRPGRYNETAGGSKTSPHLTCEAVDLADPQGKLDGWLTDAILMKYDLYREAPERTGTWCHLDIRKRATRTFNP